MKLTLTCLFTLILLLTACAPQVAPEEPPVSSPDATPMLNTAPTTPASGTGIQGKVLIGPACPGPARVDDTACADKPYQAEILVLDMKGKEIARVTSGVDGTFRFDLAPGTYVLHPFSGNPYPTAGEQEVDVLQDEYTDVQIDYDSGMR